MKLILRDIRSRHLGTDVNEKIQSHGMRLTRQCNVDSEVLGVGRS